MRQDKEKFSQVLCDSLFEVLERGKSRLRCKICCSHPTSSSRIAIHAIMFSGGVSEFIYGYESAIWATWAFHSAGASASVPTSSAAAIFL